MGAQLEARHLAMSVMLNETVNSLEDVAPVDRLQRSSERWSDLLLGHLTICYDVSEFAIHDNGPENSDAINFVKFKVNKKIAFGS